MCLTLLIPIIYLIACAFSGSLSATLTGLIATFVVGFILDVVAAIIFD